ncbi:hypothetical protein [Klebsiella oxytoca]|uniref:hypothetical protein n=1 Tax=Klebsiella oxytoca TaxID=571 RepID=UPI002595BEE7|nr:hypothetical protein [Klebsiella oxytoca]MDM4190611.1 hypothetical protein [Klebsiella oxytoca]MDM4224035.1 hypothetical protein [Klebsiella oxytoca]MDM4238134.1 hypothetical protein [Klebsiella oxytoca]MDM4334592.1 hypothetical protein [Klebsiella oxytoca]MDM4365152.1 hypothetical protein [Klebsiella oxytoca]
MNISTVNELIQSLESAGELSIKETKVMALAKAYLDVAAENVALKSEVPLGAIENGRAFADRLEAYPFECQAGNLNMCSDWQELRRCFEHLSEWAMHGQSETPATDRIVAEAEARGVEKFAAKLRIPGDDQFFDAVAEGVAGAADAFAKQLREGADK